VHLTRIYTKTGDTGPRRWAISPTAGSLDARLLDPLRRVQNDLFDVGADLCTPVAPEPAHPPLRITEDYVTRLEAWCNEFNAELPKLTSFILPGGTPGAAHLHVARVIARRAERSTWALIESEPERANPLTATSPVVGRVQHSLIG
jgi:cob(I)alamin adenosyltransferase